MKSFTRLYLARHGQVVNHSAGVVNGHNDVDIDGLGVDQMEAIAARLKDEPLSAVYCSDLTRTRRGAEIVAREHGLVPRSFPGLRELDFGLWAGLTFGEIKDRFPEALEERERNLVDYIVPGGESLRELAERAIPTARKLIDQHNGETIVIIAHGGVNRVILADAMKLDLARFYAIEQDYGCLNIIDYFPELAVVKLINGRSTMDF